MKIIVTGPESSGKTTLAIALSRQLNIHLVEEFAREYISRITNPYSEKDVENIARKQIEQYEDFPGEDVVYDTDLLTSIIWYEDKFQKSPAWMIDKWKDQQGGFYLLCTPDIPWEYDLQRENPHDRKRIFETYHDYLTSYHKEFFVISEGFSIRLENAINVVHLKTKK